jgi:methylenetetrahydrofolate dehydrogenase (NADP+)/methenyltetrahydrofolate cyclohydrolase
MTARIIDGKAIALEVRRGVAERVAALKDRGLTPGLATVLVGDDPASHVYVASKRKASAEAGIRAPDFDLAASISQDELASLIERLNTDDEIHAILVQLPLPEHIHEQSIIDAVKPEKDVDGLGPFSLGKLFAGDEIVAPATPSGIRELLVRSGVETMGAEVVIVGRSNLVGKPLAAVMMQKAPGGNATVTVCHTATRDLAEHTRRADILVAAIGRAKAITGPMVKEGAVVIDVGINRTEDGLVGDVDFDAVKEVASAITPVPGGVGPMTIAMLLSNTVKLAERAVG